MTLMTMLKGLRTTDRLLLSVFLPLLMGNLTVPPLSADCCKLCGYGDEIPPRTTRPDSTCTGGTCYVVNCVGRCTSTVGCTGMFDCPDEYNDYCNGYLNCLAGCT